MIPNLVKGRGITGAINYALGEGYEGEKKSGKAHALDRAAGLDPKGAAVTLAEGEASRVQVIGGQNFGYEIDSLERVEIARRALEWNALRRTRRARRASAKTIVCMRRYRGRRAEADRRRHARRGAIFFKIPRHGRGDGGFYRA